MTILPTFISVTTSSFDLAVAYSTGGPDALLDLIGEEDASALVWPDPEVVSKKDAAEPTPEPNNATSTLVPFPVFWALLAIAASFVMVLMVPSSRGALDLTCCIQCQTPFGVLIPTTHHSPTRSEDRHRRRVHSFAVLLRYKNLH
jgi:hypothetical protein